MKLIRAGIITPLCVVALGCFGPYSCPDSDTPANTNTSGDSKEIFAGKGDPYLPGPLNLRTLSLDRCGQGSPAPLLIIAPETPDRYPLVIFQHGFMSRNTDYEEVLHHVAGHGFVVAAPQMYEPGLAALLGQSTAAEEAKQAAQVLDWLKASLPEVLKYTPAVDRVGLAGHSRGGKVAWLILVEDASRAMAIAGVDPVDGTGGPFGNQARVVQGPFNFDMPTLVIGTGLGGSCAPAGDNHEQFYAASASTAWHIVVPNQGHADMLDEEAASVAATLCPSGPDRLSMRKLTAGLLAAFFRASLQGDASAYDYLTDVAAAPLTIESESK